jgi:hypothetical protein
LKILEIRRAARDVVDHQVEQDREALPRAPDILPTTEGGLDLEIIGGREAPISGGRERRQDMHPAGKNIQEIFLEQRCQGFQIPAKGVGVCN